MTTPAPGPHVLRAAAGDVTGGPGLLDRYLLESAAAYGCDLDFEGTMPLVEKHGLVF